MDKLHNISDSFNQSEKSKSRRGFINKTFAKLSQVPILGNAFKPFSSHENISSKDAFLGEIALFPYEFVPVNWMICDGTFLQVSQFEALYNLIGTTYGGDGLDSFKIPDFQGMVPVHMGAASSGNTYKIGQTGGSTTVTMNLNQMPAHSHILSGNENSGISITPEGNLFATVYGQARFNTQMNTVMNPKILGLTGDGEPFSIMQPFLAVRICICVSGIYPTLN